MTAQTLLIFYQKHRWFIVPFFLMLALGFYVDLKPLFEQFYALMDQEKKVALQLEEKERALQQAGPVSSRLRALRSGKVAKPLLDQFIQAAEGSVCKLDSLRAELKSDEDHAGVSQAALPLNNRLVIKMQLYCDYFSFYRFLETLLRQALPLRLDQFSLKEEGATVNLSLQFSAFPWAFWTADKISLDSGLSRAACCVRDPFKESTTPWHEAEVFGQDALQNFAVGQIRYVGYLEEKGKTGALVLLPDGRIYDIYLGSKLGKEQGRVLSLNSQSVTLLEPRQKKLLQLRRASG